MKPQIDPNATQEYPFYPDTPIIRVHKSIEAIRRCPICQKRIEDLHIAAIVEESNRYGFELKD